MSILKKPIKIKYYFIFIEKETCGPIAPHTPSHTHPRDTPAPDFGAVFAYL